jgi:hypothetical protein
MSKIVHSGRRGANLFGRASLVLGIAGLAGALAIWPSRPALGADYVLIHHASTGTPSVTRADLKAMALGKKKAWASGAPVQLVLTPVGTPPMKWFATLAAGISDETLVAKIKQEVFKGELRRPVMVSTDQDCLNAVASDPGALGIVSAETANKLPAGVTVLVVP